MNTIPAGQAEPSPFFAVARRVGYSGPRRSRVPLPSPADEEGAQGDPFTFEIEGASGMSDLVYYAVIALILLVAIYGLLVLLKLYRKKARRRDPEGRIAVVAACDVDESRQLLLVRRDDVEHLVLVGGNTDLVIERGIEAGEYREPVVAPARMTTSSPRAAAPAAPPPPPPPLEDLEPPHGEPAPFAAPRPAAPAAPKPARPAPPFPPRRDEPEL